MAVRKAEILIALGVFHELIIKEIEDVFVKKDGAKVLSTEDFTTALKEKLDALEYETISREDVENIFK